MKDYCTLSSGQKEEIAQNLIDILDCDKEPSCQTITFISNWIYSDRWGKTKADYDIWEIVLKNYYPKTRPILIRSIDRKSKLEYIASFTNSTSCARRFGRNAGYWIICDTKNCLLDFQVDKKGNYRNSFYPISEVLNKAKQNGGWGFSNNLLEQFCGEDEYIMKINFSFMNILKFVEQYDV